MQTLEIGHEPAVSVLPLFFLLDFFVIDLCNFEDAVEVVVARFLSETFILSITIFGYMSMPKQLGG